MGQGRWAGAVGKLLPPLGGCLAALGCSGLVGRGRTLRHSSLPSPQSLGQARCWAALLAVLGALGLLAGAGFGLASRSVLGPSVARGGTRTDSGGAGREEQEVRVSRAGGMTAFSIF